MKGRVTRVEKEGWKGSEPEREKKGRMERESNPEGKKNTKEYEERVG